MPMGVAVWIFLGLFAFVTVLGFVAARWRRAQLDHLEEWGLAGRRFGTVVTWFLLGGDLYTAYSFIAVPALVFGAGALGFFAVPYTLIIYPFVFVVFPRLWSVAHRHGFVTGGDFVRARYGSPTLALVIALTGILATMPYIALQLVGMEVVIAALGFDGQGWLGHLPLIVAFAILAAYTYSSGLRAPALIAIVKDLLIYVAVIAAVIVIPAKLGGYASVFEAVPSERLLLRPGQASAYITLALGSALALFLYPHAMTGVFSADSRRTIKRNAALLPAYSIVLALLALLGFMALASGVADHPAYAEGFRRYGANFAVPAVFLQFFPPWFVGVAMAAIAIGALVPAAIMSIAAANLYTRNIHREYLRPHCTPADEAQVAKLVSLVVKFGALAFVLFLPQKFAINLQLLGGVWIIQTLPAIIIGLYTHWLHPRALVAGWAAGMIAGSWMAASQHFTSIFPLHIGGTTIPGYAALYALVANLAVTLLLSALAPRLGWRRVTDATSAGDYLDDTERA
ncbi:MAG: sodium:solute symporter [Gammaproteobacteria bacterium]|nr:sodium:solute symporter [Gammaproteobacteria bacterium]